MHPTHDVWIDAAADDAGIGRFANCCRTFNTVPGGNNSRYSASFDAQRQCGMIVASKSIRAGAEVLVAYGPDYKWDDHTPEAMALRAERLEARMADTKRKLIEKDTCTLQMTLFRGTVQVAIQTPIGRLLRDDQMEQRRPMVAMDMYGYLYFKQRLSNALCAELEIMGRTTHETQALQSKQVEHQLVAELHPVLVALGIKDDAIHTAFGSAMIQVLTPHTPVPIHTQRSVVFKDGVEQGFLLHIPLTLCSPRTGGLVFAPSSTSIVYTGDKPYTPKFVPTKASWVGATYRVGDVLLLPFDMIYGATKNPNPILRKWMTISITTSAMPSPRGVDGVVST